MVSQMKWCNESESFSLSLFLFILLLCGVCMNTLFFSPPHCDKCNKSSIGLNCWERSFPFLFYFENFLNYPCKMKIDLHCVCVFRFWKALMMMLVDAHCDAFRMMISMEIFSIITNRVILKWKFFQLIPIFVFNEMIEAC